MSGIRAYIAVGPQFGPAVLLLIGAVLLRLLSSVNRSVTCTEFAGGSFLKLIARFCLVTTQAAVRSVKAAISQFGTLCCSRFNFAPKLAVVID